jgi:hypothetical protein
MIRVQKIYACVSLVALTLCTYTPAVAATSGWQKGRVLKVETGSSARPYTGGSNPSDQPLATPINTFEVWVQTCDGTRVGHYESYRPYLPAAISKDQVVDVKTSKHVLYFHLPDRQVEMNLVRFIPNKDSHDQSLCVESATVAPAPYARN